MPQLRTPQVNTNNNGGYQGSSSLLSPTTGKRYSNGRSHIPQTNATPKDAGRPRRMTTPNTGGSDDLFLTLANDEGPATAGSDERSPGRRRKSSLSSQYDRKHPPTSSALSKYAKDERSQTASNSRSSPMHDVDLNRRQNWTAQPSPLTTRRRDAYEEPISPATKADRREFTPSSRLQSRLTNGESTPDGESRRTAYGTNTPNYPRQRSLHPTDFAYSTPETNGNAHHVNGVDSEMSNSAASGVWEELEDLKSRIKHLEYSGGRSRPRGSSTLGDPDSERPSTRQSNSEYPRGELLSPIPTSFSRRGSNSGELHPLLRSALIKTKSHLDPGSYQFLEGSAKEALELASLSRESVQEIDTKGEEGSNELALSQKRIVWKADNLCRNLTDYCISLNESYLSSPSNRRGTNSQGSSQEDGTPSPATAVDHRRRLLERAEQLSSRVASRNLERAESRQTAQDQRPANTRHASLTEDRSGTASASGSRILGRASTTNTYSHHNPNARNDTRGGTESSEGDDTIRIPSRAATEVLRQNGPSKPTHSPRDLRISKDYTSKHPLPERKDLSPTIRQVLTKNNNNSSDTSLNSSHTAQPPQDSNNPQQNGQSNQNGLGRSPPSSPELHHHVRNQRVRGNSASGTRNPSRAYNPPSAGANLAERIEAKRQQRVASSGQLGSFPGSSRHNTTEVASEKTPSQEPESIEKKPNAQVDVERTPSKLKKEKNSGGNTADEDSTTKRKASKEDANATARPERLSLRSRLPVLFGGGQERRKSAGGKGDRS